VAAAKSRNNTLHHTAPHCTTLHHTAPHCNTLQHTATTLPYTARLLSIRTNISLSRTHTHTHTHIHTHIHTHKHTHTCTHRRLRWVQQRGLLSVRTSTNRRELRIRLLTRCVAACCSVLQRVAVCCSVLQRVDKLLRIAHSSANKVCCSVLQRVAACCSVLQCVAVC